MADNPPIVDFAAMRKAAEQTRDAVYPQMVQLAIKLWGEPTRAAWREFTFANGTKNVSPLRGTWFDFETNTGGDTRDLMNMIQASANNPDTTDNNVLPLQWHGDAAPVEPPWLIRNRLPETGKGLLVAQWGMFKTFCALDISAHVMLGWDWTGEPVYRQCGVLCIAKEGSLSIPMRLAALVENIIDPRLDGEPDQKMDTSRLPFTWTGNCPMLLGAGDPLPILRATAAQAHKRCMDQHGLPLGLIWIDTMSSAGGFEDEKDNAEAAQLMGVLGNLSDATGAVVMGIDHLGKNVDAGARGGSAKEANADFVLALLGNKDLAGNVSDSRMSLRKVREGPTGKEFPFVSRVVDMGRDQRGYPLTSVVIDWNATRAAPAGKRSARANSVQVLHAALDNAITLHGKMVKPAGEARQVKAVARMHLVEAFKAAYKPGTDLTDNARREALRAALKHAEDRIREEIIDGVAYLWGADEIPF
jgi:hypothetical protein